MRTPEVQWAINDTLHRKDAREFPPGKAAEILATEVERLEKENFALQWEPTKLKARVEAADSAEEWAFCGLGVGSAAAAAMKHMEILKKYREQNARLRAALEPTLCRVYTIGHQRGHESTVDGGFTPIHRADEATYFAEDVKDLMEDSLPELKAALNGEEASK